MRKRIGARRSKPRPRPTAGRCRLANVTTKLFQNDILTTAVKLTR